jgi:gliding motility-associated-like protein
MYDLVFGYRSSPSLPRSIRGPVLCVLLSVILGRVHGQADSIIVRFEPGCDLVKGYFGFTGSNVLSYDWIFSDGSTSTLQTPIQAFPFGTVITVELTTVDTDGETATFSSIYRTQEQLEFSQIELPNVFTPNADGVNDEFTPLNERFLGPCAQLSVYNRYGQRIFESLGNNLRWDGRSFSGEPASAGVYFYVFSWGDGTLNSTVTLVR